LEALVRGWLVFFGAELDGGAEWVDRWAMDPVSSNLLNSELNAQSTRSEIDLRVAKKAMDQERQQGEAAIKLIQQAMDVQDGLDVYA
jgi:hypothetical protein